MLQPSNKAQSANKTLQWKQKNTIFTLYGGYSPVNAGATYDANWNLNIINRTAIIKSISYDLKLFNANTFQHIPKFDNSSFIFHRLNLGVPPGVAIGSIFENFTPVTFAPLTGQGMSFFAPCQRVFEGWFIRNTLYCEFYMENHDVLINIAFEISVIIEVDDNLTLN
jgi:hypothetical protein